MNTKRSMILDKFCFASLENPVTNVSIQLALVLADEEADQKFEVELVKSRREKLVKEKELI